MQGFLLQIDITEIVLHEADEPDAVIDFFDADGLTGQAGAEIDLLPIKTELYRSRLPVRGTVKSHSLGESSSWWMPADMVARTTASRSAQTH